MLTLQTQWLVLVFGFWFLGFGFWLSSVEKKTGKVIGASCSENQVLFLSKGILQSKTHPKVRTRRVPKI